MASEEVADLVRKAWKSITDDPKSWNQRHWLSRSDHPCGTSFCLGGWMMIHDGCIVVLDDWGPRFQDQDGKWVEPDVKVDNWIEDIYGNRHAPLGMFGPEHQTLPELREAIEAAGIVLDPIPQRAETEWDVQFDKDIEFFVKLCVEAGDRITVRQVRQDDILMGLLRTLRRNGRREGEAEVPANAGVLEAQHLLKLEQRHSAKLRGDLDHQKAMTAEYIRQRDEALRALREENEDLRIKAAGSPSVRVDTLQKALKERTRQAREAGAAAREARAQLQVRNEAIDRLTALLDGQEGNKALRDLLADAERKIEILKIRMSLIHNYSEIKGL